jgi:hypothetical protein
MAGGGNVRDTGMKTMIAMAMLFAVCVGAHGQDAEKVLKERVFSLTRKVQMTGHQISEMGITGRMVMQKPMRKEAPGNKFKAAYVMVPDGAVEGVLRKAPDPKVAQDENGFTEIWWTGKAWPMGRVQYKTRQGLLRTRELWTASEAEALAFYRKHGFTQAAKDAVLKAY